MSFLEGLLRWFHIAFSIFTLGPLTVAVMASPRYIRTRNVPVLRFLNRTTRIYGLLSLLVFAFGLLLAWRKNQLEQMWLSASMTLFIVAVVLLFGLVERDQRKAIKLLGEAEPATPLPEGVASKGTAEKTAEPARGEPPKPTSPAPPAPKEAAKQDARVEIGRIAGVGGAISAIWVVILVLMVWH